MTLQTQSNKNFSKELLFTGLLSLGFSGLPFWVANLPVEIEYPYDRFSLAFIMGSALLLIGLLEALIRTRMQKIILLSLLFSMAIGTHFVNANSYRREWETQKEFFWQMTWRIPALQPGTLILTRALPFTYYSDNSLTAPLNWVYAPESKSLALPYFLADMEIRLGRSLPKQKDLAENIPVTQRYRNATFTGNTSQIMMIFFSPPGCLRVLDPGRDNDLSILPREMEESMHISHPGQIILAPPANASPPIPIFGEEPPHGWCYYFEKADLARQRADWLQVVELGEQASAQKMEPVDPSEWIPFIEGYFMTGKWVRSLDIMKGAFSAQPNLHIKLCSILEQFQDSQAPDKESLNAALATRESMDCELR